MMRAVFLSVMMTAVLFLSSCTKNKDDDKKDPGTKVTLITASKWKYSDAGLDMNNDGVKESNLPPGILTSCDTDNTITFKSDLSGGIDEGATKCEASSPQTVPFTWSINAAGDALTMSTALFIGLNGDIKIIELTASKLTISKVVTTTVSGFPVTANVIVFLVH
jgi:hypothetical protein